MEERLLGGLIRHPFLIHEVLRLLKPDHFTATANRVVFGSIVSLDVKGTAIDLVQVAETLHGQGQVDEAGGYVRLADLWEAACDESEIADLARKLGTGGDA